MIDVRKEYKWIQGWINEDLDNLGTDIDTRVFKAEEVAVIMQIYNSEVVKNNVVLDGVSVSLLEMYIYHEENEGSSRVFRNVVTEKWYYEDELRIVIGNPNIEAIKNK